MGISKIVKWLLILGILVGSVIFSVSTLQTPVPSEVRSKLCPTAFAADDNPLVRVPINEGEAVEYSFEEFCTLVIKGHPNLKSLHRVILKDEVGSEWVTVVLFAYFEGIDKPLKAEKRFDAPYLGKFDFSPSEPRFGDGEIVLPVKKDYDQIWLVIVGACVLTVVLIAIVIYAPALWEAFSYQ